MTGVQGSTAKGCEVEIKLLQGRIRKGRSLAIAGVESKLQVARLNREGDETEVNILCAGDCGTALLVDRYDSIRPKIIVPHCGYALYIVCRRAHHSSTAEEIGIIEGAVLCKGPPLVRAVSNFTATVLTMASLHPPIIPGSIFELYLHGQEVGIEYTHCVFSMNHDY